MDRAQLQNDSEEAQRLILDGRQVTMWTTMPGIIESVNLTKMTCTVQVALKASFVDENNNSQIVSLPLLQDVPLVFQNGGGFALTFPVEPGDECLLHFASRCIDAWWQLGGEQIPMEARMHDLSDAFAVVGPKSIPNVISDIATDAVQLRNTDGDSYVAIVNNGNIEFVSAGKFTFENEAFSLKTLLTDLQTTLNTFMGTLAGFSGGVAPVTQAMLQVPATAAQVALAAVLVEINGLLE